jgi:hypothetical protein
MGMTYEHQEWLLAMVDEFKLHPRLAKLRGKSPAQEWRMLDRMVCEEIQRRAEQEEEKEKEKERAP